MINIAILEEVIAHYGEQIEQTVCMEECAELVQSISKAIRGKIDKDNMTEEIADVLLCIEMLKTIHSITDAEISQYIKEKQQRMLKRIGEGND